MKNNKPKKIFISSNHAETDDLQKPVEKFQNDRHTSHKTKSNCYYGMNEKRKAATQRTVNESLQKALREMKQAVQDILEQQLPPATSWPCKLHEAMRYSVLAGGKRMRPALCLLACEALGGKRKEALLPAAAVELVHVQSLILDDLPQLDNDSLRRGKPTCHIAFGESTAILTAHALHSLAFAWAAQQQPPAPYAPTAYVQQLALASGHQGISAGELEDLQCEGRQPQPDIVQRIHLHKTAALMRCAVCIGSMAAGAHTTTLRNMQTYGTDLGMAFQIVDDILDATCTTQQLGKSAGIDKERNKMTYVSLYGIEGAKKQARQHVESALEALQQIQGLRSNNLHSIAEVVLQRAY